MWHEWIYKEIGQARLMLNDLESCQHLVEARRISHKVKNSLDIVQTGVWELGVRFHEARMKANKEHSARPAMREQPAADSLSGWRVLLADDEPALLELISRKLGGLVYQWLLTKEELKPWNVLLCNSKSVG